MIVLENNSLKIILIKLEKMLLDHNYYVWIVKRLIISIKNLLRILIKGCIVLI